MKSDELSKASYVFLVVRFLIAPPGTATDRINKNNEDEENDIDDSQRPPLLPEVVNNSSFAGVAVIA